MLYNPKTFTNSMTVRIFSLLLVCLLGVQACSKTPIIDNTDIKSDEPDSLIISWKNKPINTFDTLRLLIYKSEEDYYFPLSKPLYDTVFTYQQYQKESGYMKIYPKFDPGTYWFKVFSTDGPEIRVHHNQGDKNKMFKVLGGTTNRLDLYTETEVIKSFVINKITVTNFALSAGPRIKLQLDEIWNTAYANREANKTLLSVDFNSAQLPYTISGLDIKLRGLPVWWSDPEFHLSVKGSASYFNQSRIDFTQSFRKAKVFNNQVYVWNNAGELAYIIEGKWVY